MERIDGRDPFSKFGKMEQIDGLDSSKKLRKVWWINVLGVCYIICMCVCVGVLDTTTASDNCVYSFCYF
jgi:hypothetical protein